MITQVGRRITCRGGGTPPTRPPGPPHLATQVCTWFITSQRLRMTILVFDTQLVDAFVTVSGSQFIHRSILEPGLFLNIYMYIYNFLSCKGRAKNIISQPIGRHSLAH